MVLQSRRVWLAGQFVPAQLETADGKIVNVYWNKDCRCGLRQ